MRGIHLSGREKKKSLCGAQFIKFQFSRCFLVKQTKQKRNTYMTVHTAAAVCVEVTVLSDWWAAAWTPGDTLPLFQKRREQWVRSRIEIEIFIMVCKKDTNKWVRESCYSRGRETGREREKWNCSWKVLSVGVNIPSVHCVIHITQAHIVELSSSNTHRIKQFKCRAAASRPGKEDNNRLDKLG